MATPPAAPPPQFRLFSNDNARRLRVMNARPPGLGDLYHLLLRTSWTRLFLLSAASFLVLNALFGLAYWLVGGVANAESGSYADHFFFSVDTFATVGYGYMYPASRSAHSLVTVEVIVSLFGNAVVTGLAFAKFARPTARILWAKKAVISDREGVPTLMFRVANERRNHVVEATMRAAVLKAEVTKEGESIRRVVDLPLVRASTPTFILTWTVMHQITKDSPLYGVGPEQLRQMQAEIVLTLTGLDETLAQTIHSRTSFLPEEVAYESRFSDVISMGSEGRTLDYGRFHDVAPAPLTRSAMGL